ncbi:uncharacterized protein [Choristoneura fumiferana]|uniref:uncharacterized protein n=1 Tax=Choristoneura fumiferana TaxID=7141 RepID=UPI003D1585B3
MTMDLVLVDRGSMKNGLNAKLKDLAYLPILKESASRHDGGTSVWTNRDFCVCFGSDTWLSIDVLRKKTPQYQVNLVHPENWKEINEPKVTGELVLRGPMMAVRIFY